MSHAESTHMFLQHDVKGIEGDSHAQPLRALLLIAGHNWRRQWVWRRGSGGGGSGSGGSTAAASG